MRRRLIKRYKKQKAFTLIELLAVILILGIIALIAIPTVNNVVDQSRQGASERTGDTLVNSAETYHTMCMLSSDGCNNNLVVEARTKGKTIKELLDIKGDVPEASDFIQFEINRDGEVELIYNLGSYKCSNMVDSNGDVSYSASSSNVVGNDGVKCSKGNIENVGSKVYADGTEIFFNPNTGMKCTKEEAIANYNAYIAANPDDAVIIHSNSDFLSINGMNSGCMRWHAFGDADGNDNVDLLLDHSLEYSNFGERFSEYLNSLYEITRNWNNYLIRNDKYDFDYNNNDYANLSFTIDYSGYKARAFSLSDLENIMKMTFGVGENYAIDNKYSWVFDNIVEFTYYEEDGELSAVYNNYYVLSPYLAQLDSFIGVVEGEPIESEEYVFNWNAFKYDNYIEVMRPVYASNVQMRSEGSVIRPVITIPKSLLN